MTRWNRLPSTRALYNWTRTRAASRQRCYSCRQKPIDGTNGHLDGIFSIGKVADRIKGFLEK